MLSRLVFIHDSGGLWMTKFCQKVVCGVVLIAPGSHSLVCTQRATRVVYAFVSVATKKLWRRKTKLFLPAFFLRLYSLQWSRYWRSFGQGRGRLLLFQPSDVTVLWWHVERARKLLDRQPSQAWTERPLRWLSEAKSSACWCTALTAGRVITVSQSGYRRTGAVTAR